MYLIINLNQILTTDTNYEIIKLQLNLFRAPQINVLLFCFDGVPISPEPINRMVSPVLVNCNILIGQKCPLMYRSELLMVIIELYDFQQNCDCSAKISALCYVLSKFSTF